MDFGHLFQRTKETAEPIDVALFEKYIETDFLLLENLDPDSESVAEQRSSLERGEIDCPELRYENIASLDADGIEAKLLDLKAKILDGTVGDAEQLYLWTLNERIAKVRMLQETQALAMSRDKVRNAQRFFHYSKFVYGAPEPMVYRTVVESLHRQLALHREGAEPEDHRVLQEVLQRSGPLPVVTDRDLEPDTAELDPPITDIDEIVRLFQDGLQKMEMDNDYQVVVEANKDNISVRHDTQKIIIPAEDTLRLRPRSRQLTLARIQGLIVHEVGTHALRRLNGRDSGMLLLANGLDRYEIGEEGLAIWREYQMTGEADYAGFHAYFAASLALGLDDHPPRNFGEVYRILRSYYRVCEADTDEAAADMAWKRTVRTFRGTTGIVPGCIFTKDTIYRKGHVAITRLHDTSPELFHQFNIGKFDPMSERQRERLQRMGVL